MASATTMKAENRRQELSSSSSAILNSNPLLFIAFSLLFLPLTITTTSIIQSFLTLTSSSSDADVTFTLKTLIPLIPIILSTFTAISLITHTTLQIITTNPKTTSSLTLISTVKSLLKPLVSAIFISGAFTQLSFSLINFITKPLVKRFDVTLVSFAFALCILIAIFFISEAILGFPLPSTLWLHSFLILLYELGIFGGSLFCGVGVFYFNLMPMWLLVIEVSAIYVHSSMALTQFVVGNTVLYVRGKVATGELVAKSAVDAERVRSGFDTTMMLLQLVWIGITFVGLDNRG